MVDSATARHHGVCPRCEGYGGRQDPDGDGCPNELCQGSCSGCWCPGCHDGRVPIAKRTPELLAVDPEEWGGSWEAYAAIRGHRGPRSPRPAVGQLTLDG